MIKGIEMNFLIVDSLTGKKSRFCVTGYATLRGAKIACTRMNKDFGTTKYVAISNEKYSQSKV